MYKEGREGKQIAKWEEEKPSRTLAKENNGIAKINRIRDSEGKNRIRKRRRRKNERTKTIREIHLSFSNSRQEMCKPE